MQDSSAAAQLVHMARPDKRWPIANTMLLFPLLPLLVLVCCCPAMFFFVSLLPQGLVWEQLVELLGLSNDEYETDSSGDD